MYCQCILTIQLHQFENIHSAEIRPEAAQGQFCCCDHGDHKCRQNVNDFPTNFCDSANPCDTTFAVTLPECQIPDPCSTILYSDVFIDISTSANVNYKFQFFLIGSPSESVRVRAWAHYISSIFSKHCMHGLVVIMYYVWLLNILKSNSIYRF